MPQTSPISWATLSIMIIVLMYATLPINLIIGCNTSSNETPFNNNVNNWIW